MNRGKGGVENVKHLNHLDLIIARCVQGKDSIPVHGLSLTKQMYPKNGSSLPLDIQLCLPFHVSPLLSLSFLCRISYGISSVLLVSADRCTVAQEASAPRMSRPKQHQRLLTRVVSWTFGLPFVPFARPFRHQLTHLVHGVHYFHKKSLGFRRKRHHH